MINKYNDGVQKHVNDTLVHKRFFIDSCLKMLDFLYKDRRFEEALELAQRCSTHDHSKLIMDEVLYFIKLQSTSENGIPNGVLTEEQRLLIELHWKSNRHHPEHFSDYHEMTDVDIMEMVVDWKARSCQFKTDFMKFVNTIPQDRFGFDEEFFEKVLSYCKVLND